MSFAAFQGLSWLAEASTVLILIEIFGVFLSRALLHIFPSFSLLLHLLLSQFRVFLSHFSAFYCGAPRPLFLVLATHFFPLSSAPSNLQPEAFLVFTPPPFFGFIFNYQKCFHLSLSQLYLFAPSLCALALPQLTFTFSRLVS